MGDLRDDSFNGENENVIVNNELISHNHNSNGNDLLNKKRMKKCETRKCLQNCKKDYRDNNNNNRSDDEVDDKDEKQTENEIDEKDILRKDFNDVNRSDNEVNEDEEDDDEVNERFKLESLTLNIYDNEDMTGNLVINGKEIDLSSERYSVLSYEQVARLAEVMTETVPIHGRGNFPTLEIKLKELVQVVKSKLEEDKVNVRDIRLNGGATSFVLSPENSQYNDIDLIFFVDLSDHRTFDKVRSVVLDSLLDFLPEGVNKKRISSCSMKEAYVHKMVKVTENDRWSLISLSNNHGRNVELKFVDVMRRPFEFSVDSFQIILDSLFLFYEFSESKTMSENFYPTVIGESVYGDFREALLHLQKRLIATRNPEEIRGGGLLKYCYLLVRNYKPARPAEIKNLERYMCSRFFIDFSEIPQQRNKLENYLANHFFGEDQIKFEYLMTLYKVVDESTVCLMGHERRQTLNLIEELAYHFYYQDQQKYLAKQHYDLQIQHTPHSHIPPPPPPPPHHHHHHHHHAYYFSNTGGLFYTPYHSTFAPHHHQASCFTPCHCCWMTCA